MDFCRRRADCVLAALRRMTPAEASVILDGQLQRIEASVLAPGDLLVLHEVDRIATSTRWATRPFTDEK